MCVATNNPHVELGFSATVPLISVVRSFVSEFYERVLSRGAREMVAMATHELLENAVKYSAEDRALLRIDVEAGEASDRVTIRIKNRSHAENIAPLQNLITSLHEAPDPLMHYLTLMRETAKRKTGSGLGLARIRAEAGMSLALELDGNNVCIVAKCDVEKRDAA